MGVSHDDRRLEQLVNLLGGLFDDMVPDRGTVQLLDAACTALWRRPDFDEVRPASDRLEDAPVDAAPNLFSAEEIERLIVLGGVMAEGHPHEPHWYLNVVSTLRDARGGPRFRVLHRSWTTPTTRAGLLPRVEQPAEREPLPAPRLRGDG